MDKVVEKRSKSTEELEIDSPSIPGYSLILIISAFSIFISIIPKKYRKNNI